MTAADECLFPTPLTERKTKRIEAALSHPTTNQVWELQQLALTRGGLLNDTLRQRAYPVLMGCPPPNSESDCSSLSRNQTNSKQDCLDFDVARGTWDHLPGASVADRQAYLNDRIVYALDDSHHY